MQIDKKLVKHIANLARLELKPEEEEIFSEQLTKILTYVEKLNEIDTEKVEPTAHVLPINNVMRKDEETPSLPVEKVLGNAPDKAKDFFKVPKIID